eukprot:3714825-Pyramimonas_sp.AAC.1
MGSSRGHHLDQRAARPRSLVMYFVLGTTEKAPYLLGSGSESVAVTEWMSKLKGLPSYVHGLDGRAARVRLRAHRT